jgi:hypothetical protein
MGLIFLKSGSRLAPQKKSCLFFESKPSDDAANNLTSLYYYQYACQRGVARVGPRDCYVLALGSSAVRDSVVVVRVAVVGLLVRH